MDLVLNIVDEYFVDMVHVYPTSWPRDYWGRQLLTLYPVIILSGIALYLLSASLNYYLVFDRRLEKHPLFLKNQKRREITTSLSILPLIGIFSLPLFLLEIKGYSKLFDGVRRSNFEWLLHARDIVGFILFTDFAIYWIHRWMHHRLVYRHIHKTHHLWKIPTPFASHAFHPVDGFLQSLPYHLYPFLFPLHKYSYLILFCLVNIWTISIHDGDYRVPDFLRPFINGSAHHTDHHLYYNYNYGQYFTFWDRIGGSFKTPSSFLGKTLVEEITERQTNGKHHEN